jgi:pimeloyl-ACP methyl ester carboxylesterase
MEQYQKIEIPVYLMAGAKSPDYFHIGLQALAKNINHSAITVLKNHNHYSPEENVTEITRHLKSFFKTAYLS